MVWSMFSGGVRRRARVRPARWEVVLVGTWFVVFAILAAYFPRTGDDWAWGAQDGLTRLHHFFSGLNGRYGGNLLAVALVRAGPLTPVIVSAVVTTSLVLVLQLAGNRTPLGYGVAGALFIAMPLGTWRQSVVWLSGFVNYAFAGLAALIFLAIAQAEWFDRLPRPGALRLSAVAIGGFVGQLFMEHVTVCVCGLAAALSLIHRRSRGRWPVYILTWMVAAFAGAIAMFSNSAYRNAASGGEYQSVQSTSGKHALKDLAVKLVDTLPTQAVVEDLALNAVLALAVLFLVGARRRLRTPAGLVVATTTLAFLVLSYGLWLVERHRHVPESSRALAFVAAVLMLCVLVACALAVMESREQRWTILVACAAFVLMVGPLLMVNPVGPRSFYPSYVVLLVIVNVLVEALADSVPRLSRMALAPLAQLATVGLVAMMFVVYVTMHRAVDRRIAQVRTAAAHGESHVDIRPLPHPYFVHDGDPYWSLLAARFKAYYGIPSDIAVNLEPNPWRRDPGKPAPKPVP
jgi:hypothetical protein